MPYWFETQKIHLPKELKRNHKLTNEDKEDIKLLYASGWAIRKIQRKFNFVSRRIIQFVLFPERLVAMRRNRDVPRYYNKEKHRKYMQDHRKYKKSILEKNND